MSWIILFLTSMFTLVHPMEMVSVPSNNNQKIENDRPIIGVLAQEIAWKMEEEWSDTYNSYIAASYIKFVEGGGARAVPIW